ncbi:hypothetical protein J2Z21_009813 [Streptomyces griseochromogenes]|uniref:Uncharacterized protein n=1 Tax=Streptomyces griseochromogenes TaxID=68214 RepID=A0ABS4MBK4_9ACTN|nr:hypothetical protein [Streptomyces griseochromogenes]MBP2056794.1 hypothetical protein [Streptomyces griseochromogenes]
MATFCGSNTTGRWGLTGRRQARHSGTAPLAAVRACAAAATSDAVRHRRAAALDTTRVDVTPWHSDGFARLVR